MFGAVADGDLESARLLVQQGDCLKDPEFVTCAFFCDFTDLESIRLLAEAGADINTQDADLWTCLLWLKSVEMAAFLPGHGADPSIPTETGELPEDRDEIPASARSLMRAHRLKKNSHGATSPIHATGGNYSLMPSLRMKAIIFDISGDEA